MYRLILWLMLLLVPLVAYCQTPTGPYPGSDPLNIFDAFTQVVFDPPGWVTKLYRADALNTYAREKMLLPFYPFRRSPFTKSPASETLRPTPNGIVSSRRSDVFRV